MAEGTFTWEARTPVLNQLLLSPKEQGHKSISIKTNDKFLVTFLFSVQSPQHSTRLPFSAKILENKFNYTQVMPPWCKKKKKSLTEITN